MQVKYVLAKKVGLNPEGTELSLGSDGFVYLGCVGFAKSDTEYVKTIQIREVVEIPEDMDAFRKIQEAVVDALDAEVFAYGEDYLFYQISDNTWRKAKMERTSSDFGRLCTGFALSVDASPKQKFNRLTNLNKAFGLGLTVEDIRDARDGVNN